MQDKRKEAAGDEIPAEKWLVAYRNPQSKKRPEGSAFMRQFYAAGYYEAYDTVMTYAEKLRLEVLWFREKRSCEPFVNSDFPVLESLCTFCNKKFNHAEPIPCHHDNCRSEFCSRECMKEHCVLKHRTG
jgi:hypothetical protein